MLACLWEPTAPLQVADAKHIGSELNGVRQRLAFSPELTTAARVLAEVSAQVEVRDLTLEESKTLSGRSTTAPAERATLLLASW